MSVVADKLVCPILRGESVRQSWEKGFREHFNGKPLEKALQWEHLLTEDIVTVQSALWACEVLRETTHKSSKRSFLEKLASLVPNSHSRNVLVRFYLSLVAVFEDDADILVILVKFYPLSVTTINMFLRSHFMTYLNKLPNKGEAESEIVVWSKIYLTYIFESRDIFAATTTLEWISQFRYRAIHEFLLTTASGQIPRISRPEYWLFLYKLLGIVTPGPPPTLISSNRYASVLFSVGAAVSSSCPLSPEQFILMGTRLEYDIEKTPVLYTNVSLTPGLTGLAAYIITKYPTPSILPFIQNVVNIKQGANIHLFGCFLYPLAILGSINNDTIKSDVIELMTTILNMPPCSSEQRDYISQDDYSEKCIKTQSTLISLKLGQVLSHVAEKGVGLIEQQLQNATLTTFTATVLCHCIATTPDRPSDLLLSTLRLSDDATNLPILYFISIHMKLIDEQKVRQSNKLHLLYMKNFHLLTKNASPAILKKMVKSILNDFGRNEQVAEKIYHVMWWIWGDHGGLVYTKFYSMLANPTFPNLDLVIMSIVRRMCSGDRPVDLDDMKKLIFKYLDHSTNLDVIGKCIDSLTYLCQGELDPRQIKHIVNRYIDEPKLSLPICFFYSEFVLDVLTPEMLEDAVSKLWTFAQSMDIHTSSMGYKGLLNCDIDSATTDVCYPTISNLINQHEHPEYAAQFVSKLISRELQDHPAQDVGTFPNPTKKLLTAFKVKDFYAAKNLNLALFSFSSVSSNASRQQHKKQLQQNERILASILLKFADTEFNNPFDGIIMIDGWCYFMLEYFKSILNMPTYPQRRNRADTTSSDATTILLEQLATIKFDVSKFIEQELQKSSCQMFVQVLIITSMINAVYRIAKKNDVPMENINPCLSKDIGLLRTLTSFNHDSGKSSKTNAILLLCSAYVARIACDIEDEDLLRMLLETCSNKITAESSSELLSQCAAVATGVIVHVYYKIRPKTHCVKEAIQIMLDNKNYLGLSFCIDSLSNSIQKPATRKFIEEFISETNKKSYVSPDRILFMGMLLLFSFYIDNADEHELEDFLVYLCHQIDTVSEIKDQNYYLMIQGLVYYNLSNWCYNQASWKFAYEKTIEAYVQKFEEDKAAIPTLALLTGFPITNLVDCFDWGPNLHGISKYTENIIKNLQYDDGKLCSLMVTRSYEEHQNTLVNYKSLPESVWDLFNETIAVSLVKQGNENKRKLKFALRVLSGITCRIPLSNPLQVMVSIFTRTTLQEEVVRCCGIHSQTSSRYYFQFLLKFLSLSVYPQLSLACQKEIIVQIPNFISFIPKRDLRYFFSRFLSETFWQGNDELRQAILHVLQELLKSNTNLTNVIVYSLHENYFQNFQHLSKKTIDHIGELMKSVNFYDLPFNQLTAESRIVSNFIKSRHNVNVVVELFFTRYLQAEVYSAELLRAVVRIILILDQEKAYSTLFNVMTHVKKSLQENPENFLNPAIACLNMVVLTYVAYLKDTRSIGNGLEHFLFLSELVEPQVNVDCLAVVMKSIEPWFQIIRLYDDVILNDS